MRHHTKLEVKMKIMRSRVDDAYKEFRKQKEEDRKIWRKTKKMLTGGTKKEYLEIWKPLINQLKIKEERHCKQKVAWLMKKWGTGKTAVTKEVVRGVVVKDEPLTAEFSSEPRTYGGVVIGDREWKVLSLPPKFGLQKKIATRDIMISLEEALNKLRWNRMYEDKGKEMVEPNFINGKNMDINGLKRRRGSKYTETKE